MNIPDDFWDKEELAEPLARRDIAAIYKALQCIGVSQRRIAQRTGQAQSEVSDILSGRQVKSVEVLERIADGLAIPRYKMGLSCEPGVAAEIGQSFAEPSLADPKQVWSILPSGVGQLSKPSVFTWTGIEVRTLREAMRMSVREFARYLGVSDRMVSKWEAGGSVVRPRPFNQAALDTCLARTSAEIQARFAGWPTRQQDHAEVLKAEKWVIHVAANVDSLGAALKVAEHIVLSDPIAQISIADTTVSPAGSLTHFYGVFCNRHTRSGRCLMRHGHVGECTVRLVVGATV